MTKRFAGRDIKELKKEFNNDWAHLKAQTKDYFGGIWSNIGAVIIGHIILIGGMWLAIFSGR